MFAALVASSTATAHDGSIAWRTIETPHGRVHFPQTHAALGARVAVVFEDAWRTLTPIFGYAPSAPIEITVDDYADSANGFASPLPFSRIHVRAYPPRWHEDLFGHGDWLRLLVFHEFAHVLHLEQHGGIAKWVNGVLGRVYMPNLYLPRLMVEGIAVWAESRFVGADAHGRGRINSPQFMMQLRAMALDGTLPRLSELTGNPLKWPRGNGWYLFGGFLIDYQVRTYGRDKLMRFIRAYGSRPVPYAINLLYQEIYGISVARMWDDAIAELLRRAHRERRLREYGIDPPREVTAILAIAVPHTEPVRLAHDGTRITFDGETKGRIRFHPDGRHLVYVQTPNDGLDRIVSLDVVTRKKRTLHHCALHCSEPVWTADGRRLLWLQIQPHGRLYSFNDVMARDFAAGFAPLGPVRRLTTGARARCLTVDKAGKPEFLRTTAGGTDRPIPSGDPQADTEHGTILRLRNVGSFRDVWRADGARPLLVSTRGVLSFAQAGEHIALVVPHGTGHEIHIAGYPKPSRRPALAHVKPPSHAPDVEAAGLSVDEPYRAVASLRPRSWRPVVFINGEALPTNTTLGVQVGGRDALELLRYEATAQTDLELDFPLLTGSLTMFKWEPTWLVAGTYLHTAGWARRAYRWYLLRRRLAIGTVGGSWRYPVGRAAWDFSLNYRFEHAAMRDDVGWFDRTAGLADPFGPPPITPFAGTTATLTLGAAWTRSEFYLNSVTAERKQRYAVFVTVGNRWLLSDRPRLRGDLHVERAWPLGGHRVLQWRARLGVGAVIDEQAAPFTVQGLAPFDANTLLFGGAGGDFSVVRGFVQPLGVGVHELRGHGLGWSSMQVHLPLRAIGSGFDALPFYLGRAWAVAFVDAAAVWDASPEVRDEPRGSGWAVSLGAELRVGLEVGYISQGALALGAAWSTGTYSGSQVYIRLAP